MYYTFTQTGEEITDGQPQKYFKVSIFKDEAKTIFIGENTYVASGVAYDDPEGEFIKTMNIPPPTKHIWNYQDDRRIAYPSFADQFDLLYHGGYEAWKTSIDVVKNKYPKP